MEKQLPELKERDVALWIIESMSTRPGRLGSSDEEVRELDVSITAV